ncbi:type II toxin-antitoxin system RelE/ParE family toxin [Granulicella mallensis]|uniref:Plasmid stabilization system n=1 Tax=Granulicella mallensis (strain ATCC BAA-1857 / DSM 23137 / MP5ACTX8) TaxID=682795 RepID=G8NXI2_GRAMM|nr:type II toxin-antitoxin system RelE/ParE family toxin [Granulicella mallensis]AEU38977.1 plasmid stabilization system [Granulicella mallensis MP5ACTX8]
MHVEYSLDIEEDLDEIAAYIAADNPRRAVSFIREIRAEIDRIGQRPLMYQLRPDVGEDARLAVVGRYVILFWIDGDVVRIERVVQGNRFLPVLF